MYCNKVLISHILRRKMSPIVLFALCILHAPLCLSSSYWTTSALDNKYYSSICNWQFVIVLEFVATTLVQTDNTDILIPTPGTLQSDSACVCLPVFCHQLQRCRCTLLSNVTLLGFLLETVPHVWPAIISLCL